MNPMTRRQFVIHTAVAAGGLISIGAGKPGIVMADEIQDEKTGNSGRRFP